MLRQLVLNKIVDEIQLTVVPGLVFVFLILCRKENHQKYNNISGGLIYPLAYLVDVLVCGHFSNFYPYPFIDVNALGPGR